MTHSHLTHSPSAHLNRNDLAVIIARNCFPSQNVKYYNWGKKLSGVYLTKNNQTKTIWRAGMLLATANENMFKMINMKDLHNFRRIYCRKRFEPSTSIFCSLVLPLCSVTLHDLLCGHSSFLPDFRWWKLSMSVSVLKKSNFNYARLSFAVNTGPLNVFNLYSQQPGVDSWSE